MLLYPLNQSGSVQKPDMVMINPNDFIVFLSESYDFIRIDALVDEISIESDQVLLRVEPEAIFASRELLSDLANSIVFKGIVVFRFQLAIENHDRLLYSFSFEN